MSNELSINDSSQLPAYLQGISDDTTTDLMQGISTGGNRIGLKGSRFRLVVNGVEEGVFEENYLDVIIVGAAPAISRLYFAHGYSAGKNEPPTCYSADGITPAADVKNPQSDKCSTCKWNVKGSKIVNGNKTKACSYFRRMVVMLAGDTEERRTYKLDVKGMGLFGPKSNDGKSSNLIDYVKMIATRGMKAGLIVTRISFDTNESVPKLLFRPLRYVTEEELAAVQALAPSEEVAQLREVTMATVDLSDETPTGGDDALSDPVGAQNQAQAPQQAPQRPAPQQAAPQRPQAPQRPAPKAQQPQKPQKPQVRTDKPMPTDAKPQTPQRPAPNPEAVPKSAPPVQEVTTDDELASILEGLE